MKELTNQLKALNEKHSYVRSGLQKWMENFAENTISIEGEYIIVCELADYRAVDVHLVIFPGDSSIYELYSPMIEWGDASASDTVGVEDIKIEDVRNFIRLLPSKINKYADSITKRIKEYDELMAQLFPPKETNK